MPFVEAKPRHGRRTGIAAHELGVFVAVYQGWKKTETGERERTGSLTLVLQFTLSLLALLGKPKGFRIFVGRDSDDGTLRLVPQKDPVPFKVAYPKDGGMIAQINAAAGVLDLQLKPHAVMRAESYKTLTETPKGGAAQTVLYVRLPRELRFTTTEELDAKARAAAEGKTSILDTISEKKPAAP